MVRVTLACLALAALAGCGRGANDPGPGGVTVGEAQALDDAADMIEQRQIDPDVIASAAATPTPSPTASQAPSR